MTLVEVLVAMAIMAVVMTVVLPIVTGVRHTWEVGQSGAESVQNERILADHLYRHLAAARAITAVSAPTEPSGYLQFLSSDGVTYRYQIGSDQYVQFGPVGSLEDLAGPVSRLQFTGFSAEDFTTPATEAASIRLVRIQATFPPANLTGRERTLSAQAYLRAGDTLAGEGEATVKSGLALRNTVTWSGKGARIDSYHALQDAYSTATSGQEAIVSVNAAAQSAICLYGGTTLYGNPYIGPGGDPEAGIVVYGTLVGKKGVLPSAIDIPDLTAPAGMPGNPASLSLSKSKKVKLTANTHYSSVDLSSSSLLIIDGDITVLIDGDLALNSGSQIQVNPGYTARFYVGGTVTANKDTAINATTANPATMRLYLFGSSESMQLNTNAKVYAVVQNPQGTFSVWSNSEFFGKLKAGALEGGGKIHVDLDCDFD